MHRLLEFLQDLYDVLWLHAEMGGDVADVLAEDLYWLGVRFCKLHLRAQRLRQFN